MPSPTPRWSRLAEAAEFAMQIHADQVRKGAETPYLGHLLQVAGLVLEYGGDEDQAIAGLLHDAIEDCGARQDALIVERFGPRVGAIVRACTDADTKPKPPWRARKEAYIAHLDHAEPDVLLVSACDKLHNARAILSDLRSHGMSVFARFTATADQTIWYYAALAEVFARRLPGPIARELASVVAEIRQGAAVPSVPSAFPRPA